MVITCECGHRAAQHAQALHLLNGNFLNQKIAFASRPRRDAVQNKTPVPAIVQELYLVTRGAAAEEIQSPKNDGRRRQRKGAQDLL